MAATFTTIITCKACKGENFTPATTPTTMRCADCTHLHRRPECEGIPTPSHLIRPFPALYGRRAV